MADYTQLLAHALAARGERLRTLVPSPTLLGAMRPGAELERGGRLLLQFAPHALGWRGMNVPLCAWLAARERGRLWVMFHEVHFPRRVGDPLRLQALSLSQQVMAALVGNAARRTFISTEAWRPLLARLAPRGPEPLWLPVPSNLSEEVAPERAQAARVTLGAEGQQLLGHFGTHGEWFRREVRSGFVTLLAGRPDRHGLLLGRGGEETRAEILRERPDLGPRLHARSGDAATLAAYVAACDLLVQPYVDGPTTRRSSLMAALALGRAVVSNEGHLTEPFFRREPVLRIAPDTASIPAHAEALLADAAARQELGRYAADVYRARFSWARTVERLQAEAACE